MHSSGSLRAQGSARHLCCHLATFPSWLVALALPCIRRQPEPACLELNPPYTSQSSGVIQPDLKCYSTPKRRESACSASAKQYSPANLCQLRLEGPVNCPMVLVEYWGEPSCCSPAAFRQGKTCYSSSIPTCSEFPREGELWPHPSSTQRQDLVTFGAAGHESRHRHTHLPRYWVSSSCILVAASCMRALGSLLPLWPSTLRGEKLPLPSTRWIPQRGCIYPKREHCPRTCILLTDGCPM